MSGNERRLRALLGDVEPFLRHVGDCASPLTACTCGLSAWEREYDDLSNGQDGGVHRLPRDEIVDGLEAMGLLAPLLSGEREAPSTDTEGGRA
jgi:hypothetical protein